MLWREFLSQFATGENGLFDEAFIAAWPNDEWRPSHDDTTAASQLFIQIQSRIATQKLGYLDGVETTALCSLHDLFGITRAICLEYCKAKDFVTITWHVLNTWVRPFTAKWHPVSERGMLLALDTTDEFRTELEVLQKRLRSFLTLLGQLREGKTSARVIDSEGNSREAKIAAEMANVLPWGIAANQGGIAALQAKRMDAKEKEAIEKRRAYYRIAAAGKDHATGLALSGGGIRSATFSLGVLVALARRNLLPQFDYLSTVSGGGYLGSFLTAYLNTATEVTTPSIGLRANESPFDRTTGESKALKHLRHHSKYLASGSALERLRMVAAQLYGMCLNAFGVVLMVSLFALLEYLVRTYTAPVSWWTPTVIVLAVLLAFWILVSLLLLRWGQTTQKVADSVLLTLGVPLLTLFFWNGLGHLHGLIAQGYHWQLISSKTFLAICGVIPILSSAFAGLVGKLFDKVKLALGVVSAITAPLFFMGIYLFVYRLLELKLYSSADNTNSLIWLQVALVILIAVYLWILNINFTSPHRQYRKRLAEAYLIQPKSSGEDSFQEAVRLKLSEAGSDRAPYHLINAALNVPGSKNPAMQGRLTDFFLFSRFFCGSPLTGYEATTKWEVKDKNLDLGTAMAISGAAAAPQMGLGTKRRLSFWLALLNVRLGYWLRNPKKPALLYANTPGLGFLVKEMRGSMDEKSPWLYLSDGGHIENLGVYELLRRRCQYILAIDGEQDQRMTFAALTTLQRLAAIDLGVKIDINLDDLRLNEHNYSRSHFRFCRIEYPGRQYGYLLYTKLSLTGNEGEFLRRYRLDEPAFPHHSTADQFFTESQFEAYRSLGEHIGEKLFLRVLVGDNFGTDEPPTVENWFKELGKRLLDPLPAAS